MLGPDIQDYVIPYATIGPTSWIDRWWEENPLISDFHTKPVAFLEVQAGISPWQGIVPIRFSLSAPAFVRLRVFNLKGNAVRELLFEKVHSGRHTLSWDGRDDTGKRLGDGHYMLQLEANGIITSAAVQVRH